MNSNETRENEIVELQADETKAVVGGAGAIGYGMAATEAAKASGIHVGGPHAGGVPSAGHLGGGLGGGGTANPHAEVAQVGPAGKVR